LFIIWGFGHRTTKIMGDMPESLCSRCNNRTARQIVKLTTWITLFFIPVLPYKKHYLLTCPICGQAQELTKTEFDSLTSVGYNSQPANEQSQIIPSDNTKYAGKTPTQIAFLKHMEEVNAKKSVE